jgi:hypothetical protein
MEVSVLLGTKRKRPHKGPYIRLVPRRGLKPPPTYVDQHLKLRIPWANPPILREINGLTTGGQ